MSFSNLPNNPPKQTVTVTSSYTQVGAGIVNCDAPIMSLEVVNAGPGDVTGFKIQVQFFHDGAWYDYLGGTDFASSTEYVMVKASTIGPHQVANGQSAWAIVRLDGVYAFRLEAKTSTSTAALTVNWIARKSRAIFGRGAT